MPTYKIAQEYLEPEKSEEELLRQFVNDIDILGAIEWLEENI